MGGAVSQPLCPPYYRIYTVWEYIPPTTLLPLPACKLSIAPLFFFYHLMTDCSEQRIGEIGRECGVNQVLKRRGDESKTEKKRQLEFAKLAQPIMWNLHLIVLENFRKVGKGTPLELSRKCAGWKECQNGEAKDKKTKIVAKIGAKKLQQKQQENGY